MPVPPCLNPFRLSCSRRSLSSSLRGACWPLPSRVIREIQNLGRLTICANLKMTPRQVCAEVCFFMSSNNKNSYWYWVVSSWVFLEWLQPGSGWFHLGFGWFHLGFGVSSWVLGGFIQAGFCFFPVDHDTQTTVILSTQTTFIQTKASVIWQNETIRGIPRRWACLQA